MLYCSAVASSALAVNAPPRASASVPLSGSSSPPAYTARVAAMSVAAMTAPLFIGRYFAGHPGAPVGWPVNGLVHGAQLCTLSQSPCEMPSCWKKPNLRHFDKQTPVYCPPMSPCPVHVLGVKLGARFSVGTHRSALALVQTSLSRFDCSVVGMTVLGTHLPYSTLFILQQSWNTTFGLV